MSELPKGWEVTTIGDILQPQSDGKLIHQGWSPQCHGFPAEENEWGVLKTTAIQDGSFLDIHNKKLPDDKEPKSRIEVRNGDLLMTNAGPRIRCGVTTLVKKTRNKLMLSGKMYRMRFDETCIHPSYVEASFRSEAVIKEIDSRKTGMSESGLNLTQERFLTVPIILCPYKEQVRIANKLNSMLTKVDAVQARLDKIPNILKRFRQSVLAAATSGELTKDWREINKINFSDWKGSILSEVATTLDPNPSHRYPKADISGVPILSTQQFVGESDWTTNKAKLVNRAFFEERKAKTGFYHDDIIFARKGRLGLARYAPKKLEYVLSHTVFIIRPKDIVDSDFLLLFLKQNSVMEWLIKEMNSNTGVPTLGKGVFEKTPICVPSIEEQQEIVRRVESLLAIADTVEKQYNNAKARTKRLTQSILAKAFRGELVPQDPNDEPASILLEKIKSELAVNTVKNKPKSTKQKDKGILI